MSRPRIVSASNEENELLSTDAIKMSERPCRSESRTTTDSDDDDLIEEYDVAIFSPQCVRNRSGLEKGLAVVLACSLVVIIALAVALSRSNQTPAEPYCSSPACVGAAGSVLATMDPDVTPCHDFYRYACGSWVRDNPVPAGYASWDRFQELSDKILYRLKNLLDTIKVNGPAERKVKGFYQSCMKESEDIRNPEVRRQTFDSLKELIDAVGGWGGTGAQEVAANGSQGWDFQEALQSIHRLGIWPLFQVSVDVDEMDATRNVLKIKSGSVFLEPRLSSPEPSNGSGYSDYLEESKQKYVRETSRILTVFRENASNIPATADRIYRLEQQIATAISGNKEIYNISSLRDMNIYYPMVDWGSYFSKLTSRGTSFKSTEKVAVLYPQYLRKLAILIRNIRSDRTRLNTLRDYLVTSFVKSLIPFFDEKNFDESEPGTSLKLENWKRCMYYTNKALGFATGAIYIKATNRGNNIHTKIENIIDYTKKAFKSYVLRKFWLDKKTKAAASAKLDDMIQKVSYPTVMLNTTFLDGYYKGFDVVEGDWFKNVISWKQFDLHQVLDELGRKPDRQRWISPPISDSPFYSPIRNEVFFPVALLHLPFFIQDGPQALNFGAIGSVIGHQVTHAFGFKGMHYDGKGQIKNWWNPETVKKFNITTKCVRKTYSKYEVDGKPVDGELTLDENIADNGGLRAAFAAYTMWTEENGKEKPLPGLKLTANQLLFVGFAQMYCSAWTKDGLLNHLLADHFAPGQVRVNGAISNSRLFSTIFNCPLNAAMNPSTKCEVW